MKRKLYLLCQDYVRCYGVLDCLISVDGLDAESLKLFRLMNLLKLLLIMR